MKATEKDAVRLDALIAAYGDGADGACPTPEIWERILARPKDAPVTLVNFFKMRESAHYGGDGAACTGAEAFDRYADVSMPALHRAGGKFLLVAPFEGTFAGSAEDWDLVAIGSYPNTDALLALFEDDAYQAAFHHRTAACERQRVVLCSG